MIKWRGEQSGPYTLRQIQEKAASREIKGIYEVFDGGQWKTVRIFLREVAKVSSLAPIAVDSWTTDTTPSSALAIIPPSATVSDRGHQQGTPVRGWSDEHVWDSSASAANYDVASSRPNERIVLVYAGFWMRLLAFILDHSLVTLLPIWLAGLLLEGAESTVSGALAGFSGLGVGGVIVILFASTLTWIYFAAMESSAWNATIGKKIVGLVVMTEDGQRVTFQTASVRYFSKILSGMMIGAGFFLAAFTRKKQAFHDLLSDCTVNLTVRESRILEGNERITQM